MIKVHRQVVPKGTSGDVWVIIPEPCKESVIRFYTEKGPVMKGFVQISATQYKLYFANPSMIELIVLVSYEPEESMNFRNHYMIDIETLGTQPGSVILSIGACSIEQSGGFEVYISMNSCRMHGLTIDQDTWEWWHDQDERLRRKNFNGEVPLKEALVRLNDFTSGCDSVWANGAAFDFTLLRAAYQRCGFYPSWRYNQEMDLRTMKAAAKSFGIKLPPRDPALPLHDCLADAMAQTDDLRYCLKALNPGERE